MGAFSGDRIVWEDLRHANGDVGGNADIYLHDLATGIETQITTDEGLQSSPAISGDRIVWSDRRNANGDVYLYEVSAIIPQSIQGLMDLIDQYVADGRITNFGTGESLEAFLQQVGGDVAKGDYDAACRRMEHFVASVENKASKQIEAGAAQTLIDLAQAVMTDFGCGG